MAWNILYGKTFQRPTFYWFSISCLSKQSREIHILCTLKLYEKHVSSFKVVFNRPYEIEIYVAGTKITASILKFLWWHLDRRVYNSKSVNVAFWLEWYLLKIAAFSLLYRSVPFPIAVNHEHCEYKGRMNSPPWFLPLTISGFPPPQEGLGFRKKFDEKTWCQTISVEDFWLTTLCFVKNPTIAI